MRRVIAACVIGATSIGAGATISTRVQLIVVGNAVPIIIAKSAMTDGPDGFINNANLSKEHLRTIPAYPVDTQAHNW